jgi:HSP20 family protein
MATLVRWNPVREVAAMQNMMDRMLDQDWRAARPVYSRNGHTLPMDAYETDSAYTLQAVLPGATAESIKVSYEDDVLTIQAEVPQTEAEGRKLLAERTYGEYHRSVRVNGSINPDAIEASYADGILTLTLPKTPEAQPRTIPVKVTARA